MSNKLNGYALGIAAGGYRCGLLTSTVTYWLQNFAKLVRRDANLCLIVVTDELMLKTGDEELLQELLSSSDRHCSLTKSKKYFGSAKIRTQAGCLRSEIIYLCGRPSTKARAC